MRSLVAAAAAASLLAATRVPPIVRPGTIVERAEINDNRTPAGVLRDGVLTIHLEMRESDWRPDGDAEPGLVVHAFAEAGKRVVVPGPLIRVPEGTEIHAWVGNTLSRGTLVVRGLSRRGITTKRDADTIQVAPGATREIRFVAGAPGTYYYTGSVLGASHDSSTHDAELNGAFVIDPRTSSVTPRDRIFILSFWRKDSTPGLVINRGEVMRFTINGKAWPNTERLVYSVGDTVRFRIINTTVVPHPMHLHGFYFTVESRGNGSIDSVYDGAAPPYRVVTERAAPGRTFTMRWIPERAGNWMFHCHDNYHVLRSQPFEGPPLPAEHLLHTTNHAHDMMGGLVMGIAVDGDDAPRVVAQSDPRRKLRLIARVDTSAAGTEAEPAYGYELQEGASRRSPVAPLIPGPTIVLKRGEPVSLTVVNALREPTSVHWHGIELESYFDGVADYAGSGKRIAGAIAPGDSFEARFTPPRAGTFIYHPHADEVRQQQAGLSGALIVLDAPESYDPSTDIVFLLSVPRREADFATVFVNGTNAPKPLELRVGQPYRLRIVDIHTYRPSMITRLMRDSSLVTWRALAKDGMTLPPERSTMRPAQQQMGNGETYDFEFVPTTPGDLRFTVSSAAGALLVEMPVHVR